MTAYIRVFQDDCLAQMRTMSANSVDSVVTDPPYELGFMGKGWDATGIANDPALWSEVLRVLKPGGHCVAFSGTRTYHRMACAIEDAGFEVRDQLAWTYGQGFPKSLNVGNGWGTALKPAWEPICLARKPLSEKTVAANMLRWGTGAINVDGCRVGTNDTWNPSVHGASDSIGTFKTTVRTVEQNSLGRFPANLCHDGSQEVLDLFPSPHGAGAARSGKFGGEYDATSYDMGGAREMGRVGDSGSAARFFYCAKASKADRAGSKHPTVKPIKLMQWLCRMVTPPGGTVLDPFAGTGTTGEAAQRENFDAILIEREAEHFADSIRRLGLEI